MACCCIDNILLTPPSLLYQHLLFDFLGNVAADEHSFVILNIGLEKLSLLRISLALYLAQACDKLLLCWHVQSGTGGHTDQRPIERLFDYFAPSRLVLNIIILITLL